MEAVQFDPKTKTLQLVKLDVPPPPEKDEVIVKVHFAGVCGTDVHIIAGEFPCKKSAVTMGHEFCGVVKEIGSAVTNISRGDRVVVDPNSECGACRFCCSGTYHLCGTESVNNSIGIFKDGGWAQFCKVPAKNVYRLPTGVPLDIGALCEPMSCLSHGWDRLQPVDMGSRILVQGAGIIGALWTSMLHHLGYRTIIVSEPNEARRAVAKKLDLVGVQVVHPDELQVMRAQDFSWGVDVCVDCSGSAPAIEGAMSLMRAGGKVLIFGVAPPHARSSISPFEIYKKELTIIGAIINPHSFIKSIAFLEAMGENYLEYGKLGVKMYKLSQYEEAIQEVKKGSISKAVFQIA